MGLQSQTQLSNLKKKVLNDWLATIQGGYSRTEARTQVVCSLYYPEASLALLLKASGVSHGCYS